MTSRDRGFTIIELLISLAITMAITAGIFAVMNPSQGMFAAQPEVMDMQQRMRVGVDTLTKDLMMAGAGAYSGSMTGSLGNYFAPILPYRVGNTTPDSPGSVFSDRVTVIYVPPTSAQTSIRDGMFHAIDARLGKEVWAYIPFNLLPKLKELPFGQSVGSFNFFADGSAKVADVKVSSPCPTGQSSCWRTYLFIGEGPGGTFYQSFDVTLADMGDTLTPTSDSITDVLSYFADPTKITFKWAFPSFSDFDYTLSPFGDVRSTASNTAKSVGQTWADPAVGQIESSSGKYAIVFGSGFLPYTTQQQSNRGGVVAGTTFYVVNVETGAVFDSTSVGSDNIAETVDSCVTANDCSKIKNALQADPVATGPPNSRYITMTYVGDLDGKVWRFDLGMDYRLSTISTLHRPDARS